MQQRRKKTQKTKTFIAKYTVTMVEELPIRARDAQEARRQAERLVREGDFSTDMSIKRASIHVTETSRKSSESDEKREILDYLANELEAGVATDGKVLFRWNGKDVELTVSVPEEDSPDSSSSDIDIPAGEGRHLMLI